MSILDELGIEARKRCGPCAGQGRVPMRDGSAECEFCHATGSILRSPDEIEREIADLFEFGAKYIGWWVPAEPGTAYRSLDDLLAAYRKEVAG